MAQISEDEFQRWMQVLREDIRGVHTRLDALNGRTRTNEQAIAAMQGRGSAAAWGGGIGGVVVGVVEAVRWLMSR